jgi:molecular chaperone GrpE
MANVQKRADKDVANAHRYALEKFAGELLVVVDNLERSLTIKIEDNSALKDMYVGVELTLKMFLDVLQKFGVTPINPQGEAFDPAFHTAMMTEESAMPNVVLKVIQKGYVLKDRLLRPALVVVAKGKE